MNKKKPPITAIEIMIFQCRTPNKEKFTNMIRGNHNLQCEDSHQQREDPFGIILTIRMGGPEFCDGKRT